MPLLRITILIVLCISGCSTPEVKFDSGHREIELAVYTYLIHEVLKPKDGQLLTISASDQVCHTLALKFPRYHIRSATNAKGPSDNLFHDKSLNQEALVPNTLLRSS